MSQAGATLHVDGRVVETADTPTRPEDYVSREGFRLVKPYYFDFLCSVRQRWIGQNILDIFCREFPSRDRAYYEQALADGRLRVEGVAVGAETPMRDGMRMRHFIHRHEPPVPDTPIQVVYADADVVAVCKPAGLPVHVSGQYRKNTVAGVLAAQRPDLSPAHPVHRLDKPVSGLLLFSRSAASANHLRKAIEGHLVEKVYIARVAGVFPPTPEPLVVDVALAWDPSLNHAVPVPGHVAPVAAAAPAAAAPAAPPPAAAEGEGSGAAGDAAAEGSTADAAPPRKLTAKELRKAKYQAKAAARADAPPEDPARDSRREPRHAVTEFRRLSVAPDGRTSLVECRPRTGRTHQIRVHLQYTGHPIANDLQYGGRYEGPLPARAAAEKMGVYWDDRRKEEEARQAAAAAAAAAETAAGPDSGPPAEQAEGSSGGGGGGAEPSSAKRQRREDPSPDAAAAAAAVEEDAGPSAAGGAAAAAPTPAGVEVAAETPAAAACRQFEVEPELRDALCVNCPHYAPYDYALEVRPLWLHAASYTCEAQGWSYAAPVPGWADEGYAPPPPPPDPAAA